jgi:hypothetical protein
MPIDGKTLDELKAKGVARATFHADGSLASVEFGPLTSDSDDEQHDNPIPKRRSVTGGLVPRVQSDS